MSSHQNIASNECKNLNLITHPLVSVVITTRNEEKNLENCLISIKSQSYKNIEIIVVDNFSSDKTLVIAKRYTDKVSLLGPERSAQRNHGMIDMSVGEYVIYIDADMILSPILIASCVTTIWGNKEIIALHVPEIILGKGYFSRVRRFERYFYDGTVVDGARFFSRARFIDVGGFDAELFRNGSGEDWDLDKKIKEIGKIGFVKEVERIEFQGNWVLKEFIEDRGIYYNSKYTGIYHNEADFKLIPYFKKKLYYSQGFEGYIKKWGKKDKDILKQFGIYYRYFVVFTENDKWKKLISRVDLLLGLYFLRIMVGFIYIFRKINKK